MFCMKIMCMNQATIALFKRVLLKKENGKWFLYVKETTNFYKSGSEPNLYIWRKWEKDTKSFNNKKEAKKYIIKDLKRNPVLEF